MGITGPGSNSFARAALADALTQDGGHCRVVISRNELGRLFEGDFEAELVEALSPHLQVFELLEDVIQHIEDEWRLEALMGEAEKANPDVRPHGASSNGTRTTLWIAAPGPDHDVVQPLIEDGSRHGLVGLMLGTWPHGPTYTTNTDGETVGLYGTEFIVHALTVPAALATLRAHAEETQKGRT
ncbi:hypothetical protein [Spirillospora sp. CA-294931]|uniref:hypothetical protein n=1 Tax=Spirillospora sp. CA-294931 TaxID=3240042 RepID=UPI003D94E847